MNGQPRALDVLKEIFVFQGYVDKIFETILVYGLKFLLALLIWCILRFLVKKLAKLFLKAFEKSKLETKLDSTVLNFFRSFFQVTTDMVLILMILPYLGVSTASIFAIFGSLGLAIGFAAQGILSNFVSGFIVLNANFFKIGDYISCDDFEGEVNNIQIFFTTLKTVDGKIIKVPNSKFTNTSVTNFSANSTRRISFDFQVPYDTDIGLLKVKIQNLAFSFNKEQYGIDEPSIVVKEYTPHYIVMQVRCFVKTEFFWDFKYFMAENIKCVLFDMGIKLPIKIIDCIKFY
ncbi:mechanosensitive ion channel family protein [Borrelia sp. HM]|uniref:mechanosensitive ion channel family protein n=1 Tax=Borrelia sp. HM TaxID=1882662 RepID=UPI001C758F20|nr:mechanosensitive ion channel family protein [Borrelia sp. HM]BCR21878.1 Small-conductance mechanosensitive channel [Borrelia sp. HM]